MMRFIELLKDMGYHTEIIQTPIDFELYMEQDELN